MRGVAGASCVCRRWRSCPSKIGVDFSAVQRNSVSVKKLPPNATKTRYVHSHLLHPEVASRHKGVSDRADERNDGVLAHRTEQRRVGHQRLSVGGHSDFARTAFNNRHAETSAKPCGAVDCNGRTAGAVDDLAIIGGLQRA